MAAWREWNGIVPSRLRSLVLALSSFSVWWDWKAPFVFLPLWTSGCSKGAIFPMHSRGFCDFWRFCGVFFLCKKNTAGRAVAIVAGHRRGKVHDYSAFMFLRVSETPELHLASYESSGVVVVVLRFFLCVRKCKRKLQRQPWWSACLRRN